MQYTFSTSLLFSHFFSQILVQIILNRVLMEVTLSLDPIQSHHKKGYHRRLRQIL